MEAGLPGVYRSPKRTLKRLSNQKAASPKETSPIGVMVKKRCWRSSISPKPGSNQVKARVKAEHQSGGVSPGSSVLAAPEADSVKAQSSLSESLSSSAERTFIREADDNKDASSNSASESDASSFSSASSMDDSFQRGSVNTSAAAASAWVLSQEVTDLDTDSKHSVKCDTMESDEALLNPIVEEGHMHDEDNVRFSGVKVEVTADSLESFSQSCHSSLGNTSKNSAPALGGGKLALVDLIAKMSTRVKLPEKADNERLDEVDAADGKLEGEEPTVHRKLALNDLIAKMSTRVKLPESASADKTGNDSADDDEGGMSLDSSDYESCSSVADGQDRSQVSAEENKCAVKSDVGACLLVEEQPSLSKNSKAADDAVTKEELANEQNVFTGIAIDLDSDDQAAEDDRCFSPSAKYMRLGQRIDSRLNAEDDVCNASEQSSYECTAVDTFGDVFGFRRPASQCSSTAGESASDEIDGITFYSFHSQEQLKEFSRTWAEKKAEQAASARVTASSLLASEDVATMSSRIHGFGNRHYSRASTSRELSSISQSASSASGSGIGKKIQLTSTFGRVDSLARSRQSFGQKAKSTVSIEEMLLTKGKIYGRRINGRFARKLMVNRFRSQQHVRSSNNYSLPGRNERETLLGVDEVGLYSEDDIGFSPVRLSRSMANKAVRALVSWSPQKLKCNTPGFDMHASDCGSSTKRQLQALPECGKEYCRYGCLCASLDASGSRDNAVPRHCGRSSCMFDCNCAMETRAMTLRTSLLHGEVGADTDETAEAEAARARNQAIQRQMKAASAAAALSAATPVGSEITDEGVRKSIRLKNVPRLAFDQLDWLEDKELVAMRERRSKYKDADYGDEDTSCARASFIYKRKVERAPKSRPRQTSAGRSVLLSHLADSTAARKSPVANKKPPLPVVVETIESDDEDESDVIFVSQEKGKERRQKPLSSPSRGSSSASPDVAKSMPSASTAKPAGLSPNSKSTKSSAAPPGGAISNSGGSGGGAFKRHMVLLQKKKAASEEDGGTTATVPAPPSLLEVWANCGWEGIRASLLKEMARLTLETAHPAAQTLSIGEFSVEILPQSGVSVRVPAHMNLRETEMFPIQLRITPLPGGSVGSSSSGGKLALSPSKVRGDASVAKSLPDISAADAVSNIQPAASASDVAEVDKLKPGPKPMVRPTGGISGLSKLKVSVRRQQPSSLQPQLSVPVPVLPPPPPPPSASSHGYNWRDVRARALAQLADKCLDDAYSSFLGATGQAVSAADSGVISLVDEEEDSGSNSGVCEVADNDSDDCIVCDDSQSAIRLEPATPASDAHATGHRTVPVTTETSSLKTILAGEPPKTSSNEESAKSADNNSKEPRPAGIVARRAITIPLNIRNQLGEPLYVIVSDSNTGQKFNCKFQPIVPVYNLSEDAITFVVTLQELTKDGHMTGRPKIFHATSNWGLAGENSVNEPSRGQSSVDQQISANIRRFAKRIAERGHALMDDESNASRGGTFYAVPPAVSNVAKVHSARAASNVFSSCSEVGPRIRGVFSAAGSGAVLPAAASFGKGVVMTSSPSSTGTSSTSSSSASRSGLIVNSQEVRLRQVFPNSGTASRPAFVRTMTAASSLMRAPSCGPQPLTRAGGSTDPRMVVLKSIRTRLQLTPARPSLAVPTTPELSAVRFRLPTLTSNPAIRLPSPGNNSAITSRTVITPSADGSGIVKTVETTGATVAPQPIEIVPRPEEDEDPPANESVDETGTPLDFDAIADQIAENLRNEQCVSESSNEGCLLAGISEHRYSSSAKHGYRDDSGFLSVSQSAVSNEVADDCVIEGLVRPESGSSIASSSGSIRSIRRSAERVAVSLEKHPPASSVVPRSLPAGSKSDILAKVLRESMEGPSRIQLSILRRPDGTIDTTSPVSLARSKAARSSTASVSSDASFASMSRKRLAAEFEADDQSEAADVDVDVLDTSDRETEQDIRQKLMVDCALNRQMLRQGSLTDLQQQQAGETRADLVESQHQHKRLARAPHRFRELLMDLLPSRKMKALSSGGASAASLAPDGVGHYPEFMPSIEDADEATKSKRMSVSPTLAGSQHSSLFKKERRTNRQQQAIVHNELERQRRADLKTRFMELCQVACPDRKKGSKISILLKAKTKIERLESDFQAKQALLTAQLEKRRKLRAKVEELNKRHNMRAKT